MIKKLTLKLMKDNKIKNKPVDNRSSKVIIKELKNKLINNQL